MEWEDVVIFLAIALVVIGVVGWGMYLGSPVFYKYVLYPCFKFVDWYLITYGKVTAEIILLSVLVIGGFIFHYTTVKNLTEEFKNICTQLDMNRLMLQSDVTGKLDRINDLQKEKSEGEREVFTLREKNRLLKTEVDSLWKELEQLTEPEKLAEREKEEAQEEATNELIDHIEEKEWEAA